MTDETALEALLRVTRENVANGEALAALDDAFLVAALRARSSANESLVYAHHVFAEVDSLVRRFLPGRGPDAVLEIGPGANLGALFCFAAAGVPRPAGIDIAAATPPRHEFYVALRDYLACVEGNRWWRNFSTGSYPNVGFPTTGDQLDVEAMLAAIDYRAPVSSAALPFGDGAFDVVYSVAALEHVDDPAGTVSEIARVLTKGGLAIHEIDLKHHGSADPLRFLEWDEAEWLERSKPYGEGRSLERILDGEWTGEVFCNRLRRSAWLELFRAQDLEIVFEETLVTFAPSAIDPSRFAAPFREMEPDELSVLGFRLVARKV